MIPRNSSYQRLNVLQNSYHQKIHLRAISTKNDGTEFTPADRYTLDDVNENVVKAKYAVRGKIPMLAEELQKKLREDPDSFPFDNIIYSNIGNPQQLDQKPLTFFRQVLSLLQNPELLDAPESELTLLFKPDAIRRARSMLSDVGTSLGAYSHSQGVYGFRERVAEFITARDGVGAAKPENIFLTTGASSAVSCVLSLFTKGPKTGVLIPIPQYPLYTATIALNNAQVLPYYLDELSGWSTNPKDMEGVVLDAIKRGIKPTCMVVINPGNPTGAILPVDALEEILRIAAKYGIVLIADEVYQDNIFGDSEFFSARKVLKNLQARKPGLYDNVQLISLHSTSKGLLGECGQRGGYMELLGFNNEVIQALFKLSCISLCPPVSGQALVSLMASPPKEGDESFEKHQFERKQIQNQLERRSTLLWKTFNSLEGIECQKPKGAMYLFPRLYLSKKAVAAAKQQDLKPDEFYCKSLLENTGICTVPGSGFGQVEGTYHLRTTFLPPGIEWIKRWETFHKHFHTKYRD